MQGLTKPAIVVVTSVVCFTGGYLVGSSNNLDAAEAEIVSRASYEKAYADSKAVAQRQASTLAYSKAKRESARRGASLGKARGRKAGEKEREESEESANESASSEPRNYYCDSDNYCVERANPSPAGPTCPPGTTLNAGGVVCVPNPLVE